MRKEIAAKLQKRAAEVAERYSVQGDRKTATKEALKVESISPLSDNSAAVVFIRTNNIRTAAFFFYLSHSEAWHYLFPTDGHVLGFKEFPCVRMSVEKQNVDIAGAS